MNFLHLTVWSSRARLTSYVVLLCKKAPSTVCCANLRASRGSSFNLWADIFGSSLLVPIFHPLSKSCSSTQAENTFWKEFMSKSFTKIASSVSEVPWMRISHLHFDFLWMFKFFFECLKFLVVQNSSIGDLVPCLLGWSSTTNNQRVHNTTEWP